MYGFVVDFGGSTDNVVHAARGPVVIEAFFNVSVILASCHPLTIVDSQKHRSWYRLSDAMFAKMVGEMVRHACIAVEGLRSCPAFADHSFHQCTSAMLQKLNARPRFVLKLQWVSSGNVCL